MFWIENVVSAPKTRHAYLCIRSSHDSVYMRRFRLLTEQYKTVIIYPALGKILHISLNYFIMFNDSLELNFLFLSFSELA